MSTSIVETVSRHAEASPQKVAIVTRERALSYGELWAEIAAVAGWMQEKGVASQPVIVEASNTNPGFVIAYLAAHLVGSPVVAVEPQISSGQLEFLADLTSAVGVSTTRKSRGRGGFRLSLPDPVPRLDSGSSRGVTFPEPSAVSELVFTSGTTGSPKGVVLTHRNTTQAAANINSFIGSGPDAVEVVPLPLSHSFGLGRVRCNLSNGATTVLVDGFVFTSLLIRAMEDWKATGFSCVPAGLRILSRNHPSAFGRFKEQLEYMEIGSAPMTVDEKRHLMEVFPKTRLCMHYGLTEASRSAFLEFHRDHAHLDSVGKPAPNVEVSIIGPEGGESPAGVPGEILVRGAHVMQGYFPGTQPDTSSWLGSWFRSGDVGYLDHDGYLHLVGRLDEIINVGGRKVAPAEVESAIRAVDGIADCGCIGVEDPKGVSGEVVKAVLVAASSESKPSDATVLGAVRSVLEPYKVPAVIEWREKLPYTGNGKLQRSLIK